MSSISLGRGGGAGAGSKLIFKNDIVIKTAPQSEPDYMRAHTAVFVPVLWMDDDHSARFVHYAMPRYHPPRVPMDLEEGLTKGLTRLLPLWRIPMHMPSEWNWRTRLRVHLFQQVTKYRLDVDITALEAIIDALPQVESHVCIHGDATFANIVWDAHTGAWPWIDPLQRNYIPGDPHVDLGKMFQSCFQYEEVLLGVTENPKFDAALSTLLAQQAGLDWRVGRLWCYIHLVRLLPYQDARVRQIYERALEGFVP